MDSGTFSIWKILAGSSQETLIVVNSSHKVRDMEVKLSASHQGKRTVITMEPQGDVCSRQDLNLKTCDSVAVQETGGLVPEGQMLEAWLLFASGVHHRDNSWLLSAVINNSHPGLYFPSHWVLLCFILPAWQARGFGRKGGRQTPTPRNLTTHSGSSPSGPRRQEV